MGGKIVKEHVTGFFSVFSGRSLIIGDFIQGTNNCWVTTAGVVKEESGDLLDKLMPILSSKGKMSRLAN